MIITEIDKMIRGLNKEVLINRMGFHWKKTYSDSRRKEAEEELESYK